MLFAIRRLLAFRPKFGLSEAAYLGTSLSRRDSGLRSLQLKYDRECPWLLSKSAFGSHQSVRHYAARKTKKSKAAEAEEAEEKMSEEIPRDRKKELTAFIDDFLREADLSTVSVKKVRTYLQGQVNYEIVPYKNELSALIQQRFDQILSEVEADGTKVEPKEEEYEAPKPTKASSDRKSKNTVDEDARFAAKLQAELNSSTRTRSTRGAKATPTKRKSTKKKSAARVEDSDGDGEDQPKKKRKINRNNPFNALQVLSEPLAQLTGETRLSRPETVKRIWDYVKKNGLQDPADKRYIVCDDQLAPIFVGCDRIHMFKMNKVLSQHFSPLPPGEKQPTYDEVGDATESGSVTENSEPVSPTFSNLESDIKSEIKAE